MLKQQSFDTGRIALVSTVALLVIATFAISAHADEKPRRDADNTAKHASKDGATESKNSKPKSDEQVTRIRDNDPTRPTTREERQVKLSEFPQESQERLEKVDREIKKLLDMSEEEFKRAAYAYARTEKTGLNLGAEQAKEFAERVTKMNKNKRARFLASHRFAFNYAFHKRPGNGLGLQFDDAMKIAEENASKEDIHFTIEIHRISRTYAVGKYDKSKQSHGLELDPHFAIKFADAVTVAKEPLKSLKAYQEAYDLAFIHGKGGKGSLYMNSPEARKHAEKVSGIAGYMDQN